MRRLALLVLFAAACGPAAVTYEVDLVARERCSTRAGVETCDPQAVGARRSATLVVEDRADAVLVFLDQTLLVAEAPANPLLATRAVEQLDLETGCQRRGEQRLTLERWFDQVQGTWTFAERGEGPATACGQTPFGERGVDDLSGAQVVEP